MVMPFTHQPVDLHLGIILRAAYRIRTSAPWDLMPSTLFCGTSSDMQMIQRTPAWRRRIGQPASVVAGGDAHYACRALFIRQRQARHWWRREA